MGELKTFKDLNWFDYSGAEPVKMKVDWIVNIPKAGEPLIKLEDARNLAIEGIKEIADTCGGSKSEQIYYREFLPEYCIKCKCIIDWIMKVFNITDEDLK